MSLKRPANSGRVGARFIPARFVLLSDRDVLLRSHRLRGVELPIALFDAAGPLVPGNRGADMVWASPFACSGDFLLRLADCQGKHLIVEAWRVALAASQSCGCSPPSASWRWSALRCCGR